MIPKTIHYCWFGGNPEPKEVLRCIASWKKYLPAYEIRRWDESNYDVNKNKYMSDAYKEKKWAFVSDYCRLDVVYHYGGIYLDTDVEVIKSWDSLLQEELFCGFEIRDPKGIKRGQQIEESVAFGLGFGCIVGHPIIKQMLDFYETLNFYNPDGTLNLIACPRYQTQVLCKNGLIANGKTQRFEGGIAYSAEYFCPKSNVTDDMLLLTGCTYSIHHFSISWASDRDLAARNMKNRLQKYMPYWLGSKIVTCLYKIFR